jgi:hypothetical protein
MHFYVLGGSTQHKSVLLNKTNLSPAEEMLENAADVAKSIIFFT